MTGTPGQPVPGQRYNRSPAFSRKHGQGPQAHGEYAPQIIEPVTIRSRNFFKSDIAKYGATPGCPGWAIQSNKPSQDHNVQCRMRVEEAITETEKGTVRLTRAILRRDAPPLRSF